VAHIQRRGERGAYRYRVRYVEPGGRERSRTFALRRDAEAFLAATAHQVRAGEYVDPDAGRVALEDYAEAWRRRRLHRATTAASYETRLRRHVYPVLGGRPLGQLRTDELEEWQSGLLASMSPSTARGVRGILGSILASAVRERRIPASPLDAVPAPKLDRVLVRPITLDQVATLERCLPGRYAALVPFVAGSGLRASEALGATADRLVGGRVHVDRQLVGRAPGGAPRFGPPKSQASVRWVPLAQVTLERVARHVGAHGAGPGGLLFSSGRDGALTREVLGRAWRPAAREAGLGEGEGLHVLRHFYASMLIHGGASVKEVQARLGHATAAETLETYAHLWPNDEDRTRAVVEAMLGPGPGRPEAVTPLGSGAGAVGRPSNIDPDRAGMSPNDHPGAVDPQREQR
jgi:integrase